MSADNAAYFPMNSTFRSGAVAPNVFEYLWRALQHYRLITVVGMHLLRMTYQRTVLGPTWLFFRAIMPVAGMALIFQHVDSFRTGDFPYPLFLIAGMGLWIIIDIGLRRGQRILNFLKKIRRVLNAPRITLTIAGLSQPLFYHLIFVAFLAGSVVFVWLTEGRFLLVVSWHLFYAVLAVLMTLMLVVGISAVTSVMFLIARDMRFFLSLITQMWFWLTPIVYPLKMLPEGWQSVSEYLNPMTSIAQLYRFALFGLESPGLYAMLASALLTISIFLFGVWFMMRSDWILDEIL